jgi:carboxyl-terminal processing protease
VKSIPVQHKNINLFLALVIVFGAGYWVGAMDPTPPVVGNIPNTVLNQDKGKPKSVDFSLFWDAWKVVEDKHVKQPDDQERLYGAIAGMVAGLDDPFSSFMKPSEYTRFGDDINGNFDGIGAALTLKDGYITVVAPLDNSPAQRAGMLPEDIILKINDKDAPKSLEEAVKLIRGPKGSEVKLGVVRAGKAVEVSMVRENVEVKSVVYTKKDTIGLIKLNQFSANTTQLLDEALAQAKKDDVKGIVMDLRNNPGGLLNSAIEVTSRFIEPGVVVIERDKNKNEEALRSTSVSNRVTVPIVVLVNKGSASASEIYAGAIQDANRGKIVGETTFGKGSVQSLEELKDHSAIRITIAEWLTPKKREINKVGVKPDVEVKLTEEDIKAKRDPQLDKALEMLLK